MATKKRGKICFSSDNYIQFVVRPKPPKGGYCTCPDFNCPKKHECDDDMVTGPNLTMRWKGSPGAMARELRRGAAFLERYEDRDIDADIDLFTGEFA